MMNSLGCASTLAALATELERETVGSRELDLRVWEQADPRSFEAAFWDARSSASRDLSDPEKTKLTYARMRPKPYTTSLDSALTLVPEGWSWRVGISENWRHAQATLGRSHPTNATTIAESSVPALAICIAALKARAVASASEPRSEAEGTQSP